MKKKNILLLINQLHGGGAQKVIANLSIELQNEYNVTLVIYNDTDKVVFKHGGELIKLRLPYSSDTHNNGICKRICRSLSLVSQLRKLKKARNIAVSISFMEASNFANILSKRKERVVLSVRTFLSNEFRDHQRLQVFRKLIKLLYNTADDIVVPAALAKLDLTDNFNVRKEKVTVIYNFIDEDFIERKKHEKIEPPLEAAFKKYPVIINVGRITPPKAQWLLPAVLKKLQEKIPGARLLILGEGPLYEKIISEAAMDGLKVREITTLTEEQEFDICLAGFRENPFPYLSKAAVFIKSSVYEGFPNVIIEAMATGLPIVSSDCFSGPREILNPGSDMPSRIGGPEFAPYGILTPVYDQEIDNREEYTAAAAAALASVLTDKNSKEYYQEQSLKRAGQFDKKIILKEWISLIEKGS